MLISEVFDMYKREVILYLNQSQSTASQHEDAKRAFIKCHGDFSVSDFTIDHVVTFKEHMEGRGNGQNSVRAYIIKVRSVIKFACKKKLLDFDYEEIRLPKRLTQTIDFVEPHVVSAIIDSARNTRAKLMISLMYGSGLRVSELCSLNVSDVQQRSFQIIGKGGKSRLIILDDRSMELVNKYLKKRRSSDPALFVKYDKLIRDHPPTKSVNSKRSTTNNIRISLSVAAKKAGYPTVTPHVLRHSYATNLMRNGANLRHIQVLLGHSSLQSTQIYTHVVDTELLSVAMKFHSI